MKAKIDLNNPATLVQAQEEIREAYRQAYGRERMALARALAIKLSDYAERVEKGTEATIADKRHLAVIKNFLN